MLTARLNWHWIFLINVPIGVLTALLAIRFVPAHRGTGTLRQADGVGAALLTAALMAGVYAIFGISQQPPALLLALGVVSAGLLVAFVLRQARGANPLVPLRLFRSKVLVGANVVQARPDAGLVSGLFNTTVQVVAAVGLAVLAAVSSGVTSTLRAAGWHAQEALLGGYHVAYVVSAIAALAALVVVAVVLRPAPSPAAERVPELAEV
ncbi:MAG TPA: hypothetical protein VHV74_25785 [Pseudonocardiaceae bacterium]|nr:hypothetical protein [Pseudonocardiaceae bacterium]